jgi:hypothetical protein
MQRPCAVAPASPAPRPPARHPDVCATEGFTVVPVEVAPPTWADELEPLLQAKEAAAA